MPRRPPTPTPTCIVGGPPAEPCRPSRWLSLKSPALPLRPTPTPPTTRCLVQPVRFYDVFPAPPRFASPAMPPPVRTLRADVGSCSSCGLLRGRLLLCPHFLRAFFLLLVRSQLVVVGFQLCLLLQEVIVAWRGEQLL